MSRFDPQGDKLTSGRTTMSLGKNQTMIVDGGPSRGEEMMNYNPTLKKGGAQMKGGPDDISHSVTSGKVASIQPE